MQACYSLGWDLNSTYHPVQWEVLYSSSPQLWWGGGKKKPSKWSKHSGCLEGALPFTTSWRSDLPNRGDFLYYSLARLWGLTHSWMLLLWVHTANYCPELRELFLSRRRLDIPRAKPACVCTMLRLWLPTSASVSSSTSDDYWSSFMQEVERSYSACVWHWTSSGGSLEGISHTDVTYKGRSICISWNKETPEYDFAWHLVSKWKKGCGPHIVILDLLS